MFRRITVFLALAWVALCCALWIAFAQYTAGFYRFWQVAGPRDIWLEWLGYHMLDLRWRAAALLTLAALPGLIGIWRLHKTPKNQ